MTESCKAVSVLSPTVFGGHCHGDRLSSLNIGSRSIALLEKTWMMDAKCVEYFLTKRQKHKSLSTF